MKYIDLNKRWCRMLLGTAGLVLLGTTACLLKVQSANKYQVAGAEAANPVESFVEKLTSHDRYTLKYHYFRYEDVEKLNSAIWADDQSHTVAGCEVALKEYYFDGVNIRAKFEVTHPEGDEYVLNKFGLYDWFMTPCEYTFIHREQWILSLWDSGEYMFEPILGNTKTIFYNASLPVEALVEVEEDFDNLYVVSAAQTLEYPSEYGDEWAEAEKNTLAKYELDVTAKTFVYDGTGVKIVISPIGIECLYYWEAKQAPEKIQSVAFCIDGEDITLLEEHESVHDNVREADYESNSYNKRWYGRWSYTFYDVEDLNEIDYVKIIREDGSEAKVELK